MRFGVLGTGVVGQTIATKLVSIGHTVTMGSRQAGNDRAVTWAAGGGQDAAQGSFADAAAFGEVVFNATAGAASLDVLAGAGADNLAGKILIDVANPLNMSAGMLPVLTVCNTDSLAERIQRAFPAVRVVKALNTVNADVMVEPGLVPGSHTVFVSGNDPEAKAQVVELLASFGWGTDDIMDLGDITSARGTEMYLALWLRLWGATGTGHLNVKVVTAGP